MNYRTTLLAVVLAATSACASFLVTSGDDALDAMPTTAPAPSANPMTLEKRELGRLLFWDPVLSGDRDVACGSCHDPAFAYADGRARSSGTGGAEAMRNAPTILHVANNGLRGGVTPRAEDAPMFRDNRARSLEEQARGPLHAVAEMRGAVLPDAEVAAELGRRLDAIPDYASRFSAAFGPRRSWAASR